MQRRARPAFPSTRCRTCTWASGSATTRRTSIRCPCFRRGLPLLRRRRPLHLPHRLLRHPRLLPRLRSRRDRRSPPTLELATPTPSRPVSSVRSRTGIVVSGDRADARRGHSRTQRGDRRRTASVFGTMGERAPIPRESAREHGRPGFSTMSRSAAPRGGDELRTKSLEGRSTVPAACVHELPGLERLRGSSGGSAYSDVAALGRSAACLVRPPRCARRHGRNRKRLATATIAMRPRASARVVAVLVAPRRVLVVLATRVSRSQPGRPKTTPYHGPR